MPLRILKIHFGTIGRLEAFGEVADDAAVRRDLGEVVAQRAVERRLGEAGRPCAGVECVLLRGIRHAEARIAALLGFRREKRRRIEAESGGRHCCEGRSPTKKFAPRDTAIAITISPEVHFTNTCIRHFQFPFIGRLTRRQKPCDFSDGGRQCRLGKKARIEKRGCQ
jgi:hypothetical protein